MTAQLEWSPPAGATLIEPGVWEAPSGLYVDPDTWAEWERGWGCHERRGCFHDRRPVGVAIEDCKAQVWALANANTEMADELDEMREYLAFVEDVLAAVLAER